MVVNGDGVASAFGLLLLFCRMMWTWNLTFIMWKFGASHGVSSGRHLIGQDFRREGTTAPRNTVLSFPQGSRREHHMN